jgi:hypothetical protein
MRGQEGPGKGARCAFPAVPPLEPPESFQVLGCLQLHQLESDALARVVQRAA